MPKNTIISLCRSLLDKHGPQGWWPVIRETKAGLISFYHHGDFSYPKSGAQRFEICAGAILAQNISWNGAEKALANLYRADLLLPEAIAGTPTAKLARLIKPAGYFNQKAKKLKAFSDFYLSLSGAPPARNELLEIWGIGPETADSILLYAYGVPSFVIDAYTKRLLVQKGMAGEKTTCGEMKRIFENSLPKDAKIYSECHALIVAEGKLFSSKK